MAAYTLASESLWRLQYILINETGAASVRSGEVIIRAERALEEVRKCLSDAERRKNPEFEKWVEHARCLASRLEDEIDTSMLPYGGYLHLPVFLQLELGHRSFAKLVKKVEQLCQSAVPTSEPPMHPNMRSPTFARRGSSASEITMVGMNDALMDLQRLVDSRSHAIIVYGDSGSGKTMLARNIYDNAAAKHAFHLQSWVDATEIKDKTGLLRAVLRGFYYFKSGDSLGDQTVMQLLQDINTMGDTDASDNINKVCQGKRYLLVLDDVNDLLWKVINNTLFSPSKSTNQTHLLRSGDSTGKIILTTRKEKLGEEDARKLLRSVQGTHVQLERYKVPPLGEEDARKLLRSVAFSNNFEDMPSELKERVKEMNDVAEEKEILAICDGNCFAPCLLWRILLPLDEPSPRQVSEELRRKLDEMHRIESEILDKCRVNEALNPLAIRTLAGQLRTKPVTVEAWREVLEGLNDELPRRCSENLRITSQTDRFIFSGYSDLPPLLKFCFLYCSMFPENSEIPKKKLIRLWIAEGFVQDTPGKTEEEAAEHQLNQLIDREMLVVAKRGLNSEVVTCKVLGLIRRVALGICKQQNFCRFVPNISGDQNTTPSMCQPHETSNDDMYMGSIQKESFCRRVSVHDKAEEIPKALKSDVRLRSLLFFGTGKVHHLLKNNVLHIARSYVLLRVLELQGVQLSLLPEALEYLALLRYLGLRRTGLCKLPKSLSKLKFLKSVDIRDTDVKEVSTVFGLRNLRHLHLASSFRSRSVLVNSGLLWLVNLQTLAGVAYTERLQKELWRLIQIRKLSIKGVVFESSMDLCNSINRMMLLQSLTITCRANREFDITHLYDRQWAPFDHLRKLKLGGRMIGLLGRVSRINSVAYLYLWDNKLEADPLQALQRLPNLVLLSLYNAYDGKEISCNDSEGYPKLKKLSVICLNNLEACAIKIGAMKKLETLFFGMCKNLNTPPRALKQLSSLRLLQLSEMPEQFARRIKEDEMLNGRCTVSFTSRFA